MKKTLAVCLLLAGGCVYAQEAGPAKAPEVTGGVRLVRLKYVNAGRVRELFAESGISVRSESTLEAVVLHGDEARMDAVEKMIREIDVPAAAANSQTVPNIDVVVYVVSAGDRTASDSTLPKALEPAIAQLRAAFPFTSYRLLEAIQTRVRAGDSAKSTGGLGRIEQVSKTTGKGPSYLMNFMTKPMVGANDLIGFRPLNFEAEATVKVPAGEGSPGLAAISSRIESSFDLKPGQLVVVGKSGFGDDSLFLIVSAKVAN